MDRGLAPSATDWLVAADRDGYRSRDDLFASVSEHFGIPGPETLMEEYRDSFFTFIQPEPEVQEGISELRAKGWPIAIVTNGGRTQRAKIEAAQLSDLVDVVCVSAEIGARKPDPRIFEAAARAVGKPLTSGWMTGDDPEADVVGGNGVGLQTMWISNGSNWPLPDVEPTVTATTILDALASLNELSP